MTKRKGGSVGLHLHVPLLQRLHYAVAGANNNSRFAFCITLLMSNFLRLSEIHVRLIVSMFFHVEDAFPQLNLSVMVWCFPLTTNQSTVLFSEANREYNG
jgi:hypothetical protein